MSTRPTHRACIHCKTRKIKCNGDVPCDKCKVQSLKCEYSTAKAVRKPRTKRGGVITKCKTESKRYDIAFFKSLLPGYEQFVYPVFPIITPKELDELINEAVPSALVYALFAVTVGHTKRDEGAQQDAKRLIQLALDKRGVLKPGVEFSMHQVMTVVSISSCLVASNDVELAYFYLREAISMATILKLHEDVDDLDERARRRRMYWLLYVHERFVAIHFYRPVLLSAIDLPEEDNITPSNIHHGFLQIIKLFKQVDGDFIKAYLGDTEVTQTWIEDKQSQLIDISGFKDLNEVQQADLIVTQQWLRMLIWQMAVSRYWLKHQSKGCMSLLFPVEIAHQLRQLFSNCSQQSIQVHGSSILRKLFELSISIADVITILPASTSIDDYLWIARFLLKQPSLTDQQKQLLGEKLQRIHSGTTPTTPQSPENDPWLSLSKHEPKQETPLLPSFDYISELSQALLEEMGN